MRESSGWVLRWVVESEECVGGERSLGSRRMMSISLGGGKKR